MSARRSCRLLALSPIADDPRVRSMGDALAAAGWDVVGVGLPGARSAPPAWPILTPPQGARPVRSNDARSIAERAGGRAASVLLAPAEGLLRLADSPYAAPVGAARRRMSAVDRPLSEAFRSLTRRSEEERLADDDRLRARYWRLSPWLRRMEEIASNLGGPALWIANDWWMLPIAEAGQRRAGGIIVYDSHELATEEFAELTHWRQFQRPIVCAIEGALIGRAQVVTSVSPGITEHLRTTYKLEAPVLTLRNTPRYQEIAFRPSGDTIGVLYHGLVRPGRGLEATIESVPHWRVGMTLTIRGPAALDYARVLRARAKALGVEQRIVFAPPAPMTELVQAASASDIGLLALPDLSLHTRYALPNKLFEYMMAGLAIAVTDLPEMAALVRETGAGVTLASAEPAAIAAAINSVTREQLHGMKRAALQAAKRYCWETQSAPVVATYDSAMDAFNSAAGS